jgi:hypothetical protein
MEHQTKFFKSVLTLIAVGVFIIILQNAGVIQPLNPVKITPSDPEGLLIKGEVDIPGTIFIKGSVDANIESINGYSKFYEDPQTGP